MFVGVFAPTRELIVAYNLKLFHMTSFCSIKVYTLKKFAAALRATSHFLSNASHSMAPSYTSNLLPAPMDLIVITILALTACRET